MSKAFAWRSGSRYCEAKNRDGSNCGNLVATTASGAIIYRFCGTHRRLKQREAAIARRSGSGAA